MKGEAILEEVWRNRPTLATDEQTSPSCIQSGGQGGKEGWRKDPSTNRGVTREMVEGMVSQLLRYKIRHHGDHRFSFFGVLKTRTTPKVHRFIGYIWFHGDQLAGASGFATERTAGGRWGLRIKESYGRGERSGSVNDQFRLAVY